MNHKVILTNLPKWVTPDDVKSWLTADNIRFLSVSVARSHKTQESTGCALIEVANEEDCQVIVHRLNRAPLADRLLRAEPMPVSSPEPAAVAVDPDNSPNQEPPSRTISVQVRREVWRRDQAKCVECGSQKNLEFDHIIPVSLGGSNTARNVQLLCEVCNRRKGASLG